MSGPPALVGRAAAALGVDAGALRPLPGASGSSWAAGAAVLRLVPSAVLDRELAACASAGAAVPVPRLLGRVELGARSAALLERLPGRPAAVAARSSPGLAATIGGACGGLHARLASVAAPPALLALPVVAPSGPVEPARVLHLDLHPFNVLVDADGAVTGVVDWANAAAGDPEADRARTWAILALDPAARAATAQPARRLLAGAWHEAAGFAHLGAAPRAWACRFMLADLAQRHDGEELAHLRAALAAAEAVLAERDLLGAAGDVGPFQLGPSGVS